MSLSLNLKSQMRSLASEFEIYCVCDSDEWADDLRAEGLTVRPLGMGRRPTLFRAAIWALRFYRLLKQHPVEIVHTHNAFHGIAGRIVARLAGVPVVVQTVHNWYYLQPPTSVRARLYLFLEQVTGRCSDLVFFLNADDFQRAKDNRIVPAARRCLLGNGVDVAAFSRAWRLADRVSMRTRLGLPDDAVAVTMVARLERPKDHRLFLAGFAKLLQRVPTARALLLGSGLGQTNIERFARRLGIVNAIHFLGHRTDVPAVLKASDLLVLATEHEGFPRSIIEGMLAALPVVATDVAGVRDAVRHEQTGLLAPYGDPAAMAESMARLIEDPVLASQLAQAGQVFATEHLDERQINLRIGRTYRRLLAGRGIVSASAASTVAMS